MLIVFPVGRRMSEWNLGKTGEGEITIGGKREGLYERVDRTEREGKEMEYKWQEGEDEKEEERKQSRSKQLL